MSAQEWMPAVDADYDRDLDLEFDACVIGTGAGGAVLASELAEGGRSVVMLEKGAYNTRKDFNQQEKDMMIQLFEEGGARTTRDGGMTILHARTVGGSTTVNWAICFDPPAGVLQEWTEAHGVERVRLADLRPSLDKVRHVLNVQKIKPNEVPENGRLLLEGAARLGLHADRFEHSRTNCVGSGFCILGCSYDRKQTMLVTYVPRAIHFGAQLMPNAEVRGFEREGDRITAVTGQLMHPKTGRTHNFRIRAKLFSVSCGAISTPVLLKRNGLGNAHVGQNLRLHPTTAAVAVFDREIRAYEGIHYTTYVKDLEPEGIIIESVFAYPGLMGSAVFGWGDRTMRLMQDYNRMAGAIVLLHDDGAGSVGVGAHGQPVIDYWVTEKDQAKFKKGLKTVAAIYFAAGAKKVIIPHVSGLELESASEIDRVDALDIAPNRLAAFSAHQMGTAAMGASPETSATDSWGRLWGYDNLFVCDGSLMPTSIGVNPQITIAALADRTARHILEHAARYFA